MYYKVVFQHTGERDEKKKLIKPTGTECYLYRSDGTVEELMAKGVAKLGANDSFSRPEGRKWAFTRAFAELLDKEDKYGFACALNVKDYSNVFRSGFYTEFMHKKAYAELEKTLYEVYQNFGLVEAGLNYGPLVSE